MNSRTRLARQSCCLSPWPRTAETHVSTRCVSFRLPGTVPALDQACTKSAGAALLDWLWLGFFTRLLSLQSCPLPELQMSS